MDLISIVVPIYNASLYLKDCINGLINQTYQNLEIILINDGSTDNSYDICSAFAKNDSRIILINKSNEGVSRTRSLGLSIASGKYIYFCDSDDIPEVTLVESLHEAFIKFNIQMVCCGYKILKDGISYPIECHYDSGFIDKKSIVREVCFGNSISGYLHNKMFITSIAKSIEFNSNIHICEDKIFCLDYLLKVDKTYFLKENLYNYRFNNFGALNSSFNRKQVSKVYSDLYVYNYLASNSFDKKIKKKAYVQMLLSCSSIFWKSSFSKLSDKKDICSEMALFYKKNKKIANYKFFDFSFRFIRFLLFKLISNTMYKNIGGGK